MPQQNWAKLAKAEDVAKLAKVSPSTVSRVFDPKWDGKVREQTRERILRAAEQLGYTPNAIARSLNANRTNIVAVVLGENVGYFFSEVFFRLMGRIQASGRQVLTFETSPTHGIEHIVRQVHQYRVDAIIIMANATTSYIEDYFYEYGTPVILFNRDKRTSPASSVRSATAPAIRQAVGFLVQNGHRRLAHISGEGHNSNERERTECFLNTAAELGARVVHQINGDYSYRCGYAGAAQIMATEGGVDAIFCADDTMAAGVMDGVRAMGLSVPGNVSVMGFDNTSVAQMEAYALTTIGHHQPRLIQATLEVLDIVMEAPARTEERLLPMELVVRTSVRTGR